MYVAFEFKLHLKLTISFSFGKYVNTGSLTLVDLFTKHHHLPPLI